LFVVVVVIRPCPMTPMLTSQLEVACSFGWHRDLGWTWTARFCIFGKQQRL